ncbi:MAG TPA: hypothetical protein VGT05_03045 [Patescibacteria group bacterium]|nr:hypothetical protein [Patescibacteria group bacterium]
MILLGLCIALIIVLFLLSREVSRSLATLFFRLTKNEKITLFLLSVILLPGVVVHELSHLLTAHLLFVKAGKMEFFPQVQGEHIKLGSVAVARSDPLRKLFIGVSPLLFGISLLFALSFFLSPFSHTFSWQMLLFVYTLFEVGNTMFSSKKDMEGARTLLFLLVIGFLLLIFFSVSVRQQVFQLVGAPFMQQVLLQLDSILFCVVVLDAAFFLLAKYSLR